MVENQAECLKCGGQAGHRHKHDEAHDVEGTHMAGSERFVCMLCGHTTFAGDVGADKFSFFLDNKLS